ncbi:hypothetical protein ANCCAN_22005 [Ancylostoma caninum]|uniref:Uncharacterized protein n=1 Tax=Ancylostoma caninum TaxID=29170 RepID=A0A368FJE8_ANCCA|nr:hypothetical protein ANCCAN_22005 [Ancylostoma caninum]
MYWVILETICTLALIFISVIKCSDGKKGEERRSAGGPPTPSEGPKSAKIERSEDHRTQKSNDLKPPAPADKAAKSNIISKSNMPDDGYEACPDLNSKQLAKIAAET